MRSVPCNGFTSLSRNLRPASKSTLTILYALGKKIQGVGIGSQIDHVRGGVDDWIGLHVIDHNASITTHPSVRNKLRTLKQ